MSETEVRRIGLDEAQQLLDDSYHYVDVRTEAEYSAGNPVGAKNIPFMISATGGMKRNDQFVPLMQAVFAHEAKLLIACQAGQRSVHAAAALLAAGFLDVVEMRPGYGGVRNAFGQVREPGWAAAGLPTELTTKGSSYQELKAEAG